MVHVVEGDDQLVGSVPLIVSLCDQKGRIVLMEKIGSGGVEEGELRTEYVADDGSSGLVLELDEPSPNPGQTVHLVGVDGDLARPSLVETQTGQITVLRGGGTDRDQNIGHRRESSKKLIRESVPPRSRTRRIGALGFLEPSKRTEGRS